MVAASTIIYRVAELTSGWKDAYDEARKRHTKGAREQENKRLRTIYNIYYTIQYYIHTEGELVGVGG